ncbi:MAG TPA: YbaB/EbfC family nucleoid-associated protein [Candidatus Uhrbacteria bacterium]|nr:YbaB/EbfC family nucleoid-associated protein [Candidatus Uhrbacteria bacterium]
MFNKLKQFKDLRGQAKQMQSMLAQESAEGEASWGKIKVKINGNQEILSVTIDPELINQENREKLESAIKDATNDAIKKIQRIMAEKMRQSGIDLSGIS